MIHLTCPACGQPAPLDDFTPSLADECTCPKCGEFFLWQRDDDEPEDDDYPEWRA